MSDTRFVVDLERAVVEEVARAATSLGLPELEWGFDDPPEAGCLQLVLGHVPEAFDGAPARTVVEAWAAALGADVEELDWGELHTVPVSVSGDYELQVWGVWDPISFYAKPSDPAQR